MDHHAGGIALELAALERDQLPAAKVGWTPGFLATVTAGQRGGPLPEAPPRPSTRERQRSPQTHRGDYVAWIGIAIAIALIELVVFYGVEAIGRECARSVESGAHVVGMGVFGIALMALYYVPAVLFWASENTTLWVFLFALPWVGMFIAMARQR